ncbi:hypothetical protein MTR67_040058 [Solanum verrucosum]|uniref:Uncharacterized protein n=1 Tax=Solanum verrucosum TaxID=315347 RepID=A0AAF0UHY2_SOLVR|nr:hypothetical protein MTR67_040058 [Solanum verrucosum]
MHNSLIHCHNRANLAALERYLQGLSNHIKICS